MAILICPTCKTAVPAGSTPDCPRCGQPLQPNSGPATASLVCGLLMCVPLIGVVAVILGVVGVKQTAAAGPRRGRGMAVAGIVLGIVGVAAQVVVGVWAAVHAAVAVGHAIDPMDGVDRAIHLKQIATAIDHYRKTHGDAYPPTIGRLVVDEHVDPYTFISLHGYDKRPLDTNGRMTPEQQAAAIDAGQGRSYAYLRPPTAHPPGGTVVLYEEDGEHPPDGLYLLLADGTTPFVPVPEAKRRVADAKAAGSVEQ